MPVSRMYRLNQARYIAYLADHPCVDCEETDYRVLDADHMSGKTMGIAQLMHKKSWKFVLSELAKCQIRCRNCHSKRTHEVTNSYRHQAWIAKQNGTLWSIYQTPGSKGHNPRTVVNCNGSHKDSRKEISEA